MGRPAGEPGADAARGTGVQELEAPIAELGALIGIRWLVCLTIALGLIGCRQNRSDAVGGAGVRAPLALGLAEAARCRGTLSGVAATAATTVEIDSELLERRRKRRPEKSDRELVESVARIQLGREASDRVKKPITD